MWSEAPTCPRSIDEVVSSAISVKAESAEDPGKWFRKSTWFCSSCKIKKDGRIRCWLIMPSQLWRWRWGNPAECFFFWRSAAASVFHVFHLLSIWRENVSLRLRLIYCSPFCAKRNNLAWLQNAFTKKYSRDKVCARPGLADKAIH